MCVHIFAQPKEIVLKEFEFIKAEEMHKKVPPPPY
jgi:hypothetical protein